jgi:hypothetical protein
MLHSEVTRIHIQFECRALTIIVGFLRDAVAPGRRSTFPTSFLRHSEYDSVAP